ncbi:MAG: single-stranded-DNA-specific exonuclease RecJ [Clostridiales bacterium]|nr:single-stranded-DNA-specific exonuclease RecJ [Candidatus Cacconaster stercorequi]
MKYEKWELTPVSQDAVQQLMEAGYPYLISSVLASRGVITPEGAAAFLEQESSLVYSPFLMRDMDRAVERIDRAITQGEKIAVYGDYDVDGITATVILVDYLIGRGADCVHYIPRRVEDGYGLSDDTILSLHQQGVRLLITVDCGITGVEEVDYANGLGMDVVVTDHHECKETLPRAYAVVDPHRNDCGYPFKHLAGCGVSLKLVLALGGPDREEALFARYCTLAAIGTVADVMQMSDENRTIVSRGLASIDHSDFLGLHALLREAGLADKAISSVQIGFVLAPRINAAGRMGAADKAADLLLSNDEQQAEELARELCALNRERQNVEQTIYSQALEMIEALPDHQRSALVLASDEWHQGVVGIVASRLSEKYSCPSFMIHLNDGVGKGSCRSWGGFNLFAALENCNDLLLGFGGHELAAGFTIEEEKIPAFRDRMNHYVQEYQGVGVPVSSLAIDVCVQRPGRITLDEVAALDALEPYGSGNNRPVFCLRGATLERAQNVGQNRHLKLRLGKGNVQLDGIFFSATAEDCGCAVGSRVDAAFYLQINEFRGSRTVQMQMVDIRPSLTPSAREEKSLELLERCLRCEKLLPKEAVRLIPSREQYVRSWRMLQHTVPPGGLTTSYLPYVRLMAGVLEGPEPFLRAAFCLSVFAERELLETHRQDDEIALRLTDQGKKVSLNRSIYIRQLYDVLDKPYPGGGEL